MTPLHDLLSLQPALDVGLLALGARCSRCASDQRKHFRVARIQRRHFMETDLAADFCRSQIEAVLDEVEAMAGQAFDCRSTEAGGPFWIQM